MEAQPDRLDRPKGRKRMRPTGLIRLGGLTRGRFSGASKKDFGKAHGKPVMIPSYSHEACSSVNGEAWIRTCYLSKVK